MTDTSKRRQAERTRRGLLGRWLWLTLGWAAVGLGGLGVVVPGLPTTGFFVLAASCFARSSPRFERWVLALPTVGPLVGDYRAGLGMPRRAKASALAVMVASVVASAMFALHSPLPRGLVVAAGTIGVWYVGWRIPTSERLTVAADRTDCGRRAGGETRNADSASAAADALPTSVDPP